MDIHYAVVTSSSRETFDEALIPFLASLKEIAHWRGDTIVLDYGLSDQQQKNLVAIGIYVEKPLRKYAPLIDRYFTMAQRPLVSRMAYLLYLEKTWFSESLDPLLPLVKQNTLVSARDATVSTEIWKSLIQTNQNLTTIYTIIHQVVKAQGCTLHEGFVGGTPYIFKLLARVHEELFKLNFSQDCDGAITLGLQIFAHYFPEMLMVLDQPSSPFHQQLEAPNADLLDRWKRKLTVV